MKRGIIVAAACILAFPGLMFTLSNFDITIAKKSSQSISAADQINYPPYDGSRIQEDCKLHNIHETLAAEAEENAKIALLHFGEWKLKRLDMEWSEENTGYMFTELDFTDSTSIKIMFLPDRQLSEATIQVKEYGLDAEGLMQHVCKECYNTLIADHDLDVALVNLQTGDLATVYLGSSMKFMDDFLISSSMRDDWIRLLIIYAPHYKE